MDVSHPVRAWRVGRRQHTSSPSFIYVLQISRTTFQRLKLNAIFIFHPHSFALSASTNNFLVVWWRLYMTVTNRVCRWGKTIYTKHGARWITVVSPTCQFAYGLFAYSRSRFAYWFAYCSKACVLMIIYKDLW